ncbi:VIT domain-containing protein [Winogradskyella sp. PE311]|uniref:VIT domain-containing protein n=1 Tax=Winogradskyella sp. PE311 TaxID=3366943 RepID=UPI00397FF40B
MKHIIHILLIAISFQSFAQNFPSVTVKDNSKLSLYELKVNAEISGSYATVTYDMTFYNGLNRILEGELAFPLAEGQSVSHFAMDLNGKLRSAVVVEKELARVAYENTIKQRIDPALLEQTQGNNYKARVYPIPAKGYKRIVVTYEQNLLVSDGKYQFHIPFGLNKLLNHFEIDVKSNDPSILPIITESFSDDFKFIKRGQIFAAHYETESVSLNRDLKIIVPVKDVFSLQTYKEFFHINKTFVPKSRIKEKPNSITILWDASYSMQFKMLEEELKLVAKYLKYLGNVKLDLIVFSNTIIDKKSFIIKNGNSTELVNSLRAIRYDGGTSFNELSPKTDEVILFSDGLHNLGDLNLKRKTNLYCVNSMSSSNHQLLETLSTNNNGNYINLKSLNSKSALSILKHETFRFLGIEDQNSVFEVYPKPKTPINEDFNISGKYVDESPIELLFGYNNEITERIKVDMSSSSNSETTRRLWAKNKLKYLIKDKQTNKAKIIELAVRHHLISPYTSMIVLDRIEDYVRYKIEPPSELLDDYNRRLSQSKIRQQRILDDLASRKEDLQFDYDALREWYNKDFSLEKVKEKRSKQIVRTNSIANTQQETRNTQTAVNNNNQNNAEPTRTIATIFIDTTKRIVNGTIVASTDGLPLPGASVVVKGTNRGAQTDFDGNFTINAQPNETLVFSYIGYINREFTLNSNRNLDIVLSEDASTLDEVVVVGYQTLRKATTRVASVSVTAETIENRPNASFVQTLSGQVAGLNITSNSGQPGGNSIVRLRGVASINSNSEPLFIVDGALVNEVSFKSINPNDINSINVIKDNTAVAIYGNRGANGVVVITTKKGLEEKSEAINLLNEKILDKTTLKPWNGSSTYLEYLNEQDNDAEAYSAYLKIRKNYRNTPSFFLDVAEFFEAKNNIKLALRVATNLIEIDLDNHELIRALGYKLEQYKKYDLAAYVFKAVLELRPEHPQSYRDLALAYEANGQYNRALELFLKIIDGEVLEKDTNENFYGIEQIAYVELCHLVNSKKVKGLKGLRNKFKPIETDIRVVMDWNHGETDIDLYIKNPASEIIYYGKETSKYGGRLSEDMTEGYGPESFLIRKAQKGSYEISVDYYSDRVQKITGPTSLKVTIYRNYGKSNEEKEIKVLRLNDNDSKLKVKTIII